VVYGVVMAGGKGTRLWPEGRESWPKQLLKLLDDRTMIEVAVQRLAPVVPLERQLIVTTAEYTQPIADALPDFPRENILSEPAGKNTAPCIGWAAVKILERDPDAVMAVVTADHVITDEDEFRHVIRSACRVAEQRRVVTTIGMVPSRPETGYGYIRHSSEEVVRIAREGSGPEVDGAFDRAFAVHEFVEKPELARAKQYVAAGPGEYLWNSGMFMMQASFALDLFAEYLPKHHELLMSIQQSLGTPREAEATNEAYQRFEPISIDYGIMEHAKDVVVIPGSFGWQDIGVWPSLNAVGASDEEGNIIAGDHVGIDTEGCIILSNGRLIATIGMRDTLIVETPDAVLVCPKDQAQRVREIVQWLEHEGRSEVL